LLLSTAKVYFVTSRERCGAIAAQKAVPDVKDQIFKARWKSYDLLSATLQSTSSFLGSLLRIDARLVGDFGLTN